MGNIVPDSFVAVSDFHSCEWPVNKIKYYYLNEYDKIYILGDATDRGKDNIGTGGVDLLFEIKELTEKYPNRVFYIPGNHDLFLYQYIRGNEHGRKGLELNGGEQTMEDIDHLRRTNPNKLNELYSWLSTQPIQRVHQYNGKKYALAHAFFDKKLYDSHRRLCFNSCTYDGLSKDILERATNVLWFRKGKDKYDQSLVPSSDYTIIIGHTPLHHRKGMNINLTNEKGEEVKVYCVDGGIVSNLTMLKYDSMNEEPIRTLTFEHTDTSPKMPEPVKTKHKEKKCSEKKLKLHKIALDQVIVESLKSNCSVYSIVDALVNGNTRFLIDDDTIRNNARIISKNSIRQLGTNIAIEKPEYLEHTKNLTVLLTNYVYEVGLNHIIDSLNERFNSYEAAYKQIDIYLATGEHTYITEKVGNARTVANNIGINAIKKIIKKNDCCDIQEYTTRLLDKREKEKRL